MKLTIIQQKIYEIRGERIMFDFDLAELYGVETRVMNQSVKRNLDRFPKDFMFRLTVDEWQTMSSQFVMTSSFKRPKKALPYAFTEHGVTMLANILKSRKAIKMNIAIVRAFIFLKKMTTEHKDLSTQLQELRKELYEYRDENDSQLKAIYEAIENLLDIKTEKKIWEERERIGYKK
jgi:phage regulator Rha-like protein